MQKTGVSHFKLPKATERSSTAFSNRGMGPKVSKAFTKSTSPQERLCESLLNDMLKVPDENRPNNWIVPNLMMQKS